MESSLKRKMQSRQRRVHRVRKNIFGTSAKPRMSVFRSNRNIFVQLIDDEKGITLSAALGKKNKESAKALGKKIATLAKEKSINTVVFDRGRFHYHGIIAELANAARQEGLQF